MLGLPLILSPSIKGRRGIDRSRSDRRKVLARPACNVRKRLSLQHIPLPQHRSATVHNNERLASPRGDVGTKVWTGATFNTSSATSRPLVGQLIPPDDAGATRPRVYVMPSAAGVCCKRRYLSCKGMTMSCQTTWGPHRRSTKLVYSVATWRHAEGVKHPSKLRRTAPSGTNKGHLRMRARIHLARHRTREFDDSVTLSESDAFGVEPGRSARHVFQHRRGAQPRPGAPLRSVTRK